MKDDLSPLAVEDRMKAADPRISEWIRRVLKKLKGKNPEEGHIILAGPTKLNPKRNS